ncbi:Chlorophyll a-b binding protein [Psidium guajava]|nr:Chlorophyll a-b binding protein [Psidium guajava]
MGNSRSNVIFLYSQDHFMSTECERRHYGIPKVSECLE